MAKKPSKNPSGSSLESEADTPKAAPVATAAPSVVAAPTPVMITSDARDAGTPSSTTPAPRPMRLKVLYSLDDLLPNCLARAKEVVQVRVAHLDENTPIGLVDLKTCVLNVVYSSPEILHHHGCDYSVYAYDYSEPDTPMTGLGLLSWVLSLPSLNGQQPDPDAIDPEQANRMVTGRVQKNLLGLFAGDVKETLEVRMRLCRVPTLKQVDWLNHMNQYSQLARNMPPGADPAAVWTNGMMAQGTMGGQPGYMQQLPGTPGSMPAYPPNPYMPQATPTYAGLNPYSHGPPGHMAHQPQAYPHAHQPQGQLGACAGQLQATQVPTPPASQLQAGTPEGGALAPPQKLEGASPAAISQTTQTQDSSSVAIATADGKKDDGTADADNAQPAAKKRRVTRKPTGKPRGRPRLTDIRKPKPDAQPSSREGVPQDPTPSDVVPPTIKQAPTPSSAAPSPSVTSTSACNNKLTSTSNQFGVDSSVDSPHPSLSQTTPLPPPSSAAPSPVALVPVVADTSELPAATMSPANEDRDVEMTQDGPEVGQDADTEVAESPRDSDIDSLFMGSSPPPSHSEASAQNPSSPVDTSPIVVREPSKGFFPNQTRHSSFALQEAMSRDDAAEDELATPLTLPEAKPSEEPSQDNNSPSEKALSPREADDQTPASSQPPAVQPRKRGRPPKNAPPRPDPPKRESKKDAIKTDPVPSDIPTSPVEPKQRPQVQMPAPMLPPGLMFPTLPSKENEVLPFSRKRRSSEAGSDTETAPAKRGSTTALVRARIERQMLEKIQAGEMPTYCMHCGAIETPTWRKAKVPEMDPATGEEVEKEVVLCNPCGLWHHNHKTMRPEQFWDKSENDAKEQKPKKKWKKRSSLAKTGSTMSTLSRPGSSAAAVPSSPPGQDSKYNPHRATSPPAPGGVNGSDEWNQAVNKNLRRIQSSPCGLGTVSHPISLLSPDQKTRRKLFPEAKKSPAGLDGEPIPESQEEDAKVEELFSPDEPVGSPEMEKENHPPPVDVAAMELDWERELEQTLLKATAEVATADEQGESSTKPAEEDEEEEGEAGSTDDNSDDNPKSDDTVRPRTPEQQTASTQIDFKTPIRLTPLLASINVDSPSFWKSAGFLGLTTPSGKIISAHTTPTPSKLLMNMNMVSPATGEIMLEFLNEWSKTEEMAATDAVCASPTPLRGADAENDADADADVFFSEMNLEVPEEMALTSEGNAMPSSPPAMFNLYDEEPVSLVDAVSSSLFSDVLPTSPGNAITYRLEIEEVNGGGEAAEKEDKEPMIDLNFDFDEALVVDFSDLVPAAAAKAAGAGAAVVTPVVEKVPAQAVASEKKESSEDDSSSTEA
ncbi:hypothetical protein Dda_2676 [Drechslerella dactyloides]|uniref:GATA-type domain-containing protein n=1 Tax=Drechslerella dactyloides TaxID=74499 RepID=A0AAD6NKT0_DREDA|nr:hypothetical protein Dda_2676 [Drechslerella dactyloides]